MIHKIVPANSVNLSKPILLGPSKEPFDGAFANHIADDRGPVTRPGAVSHHSVII